MIYIGLNLIYYEIGPKCWSLVWNVFVIATGMLCYVDITVMTCVWLTRVRRWHRWVIMAVTGCNACKYILHAHDYMSSVYMYISFIDRFSVISNSNKPYGLWGKTQYFHLDQSYTWTWLGEGIFLHINNK